MLHLELFLWVAFLSCSSLNGLLLSHQPNFLIHAAISTSSSRRKHSFTHKTTNGKWDVDVANEFVERIESGKVAVAGVAGE